MQSLKLLLTGFCDKNKGKCLRVLIKQMTSNKGPVNWGLVALGVCPHVVCALAAQLSVDPVLN